MKNQHLHWIALGTVFTVTMVPPSRLERDDVAHIERAIMRTDPMVSTVTVTTAVFPEANFR